MREWPESPDKRARWGVKESGKSPEGKRIVTAGKGVTFAIMTMFSAQVIDSLTDGLQEKASVGHEHSKKNHDRFPEEITASSIRQQVIDQYIAAAQQNLQEPIVKEALLAKGRNPSSIIFSAIEAPVLQQSLEGTLQDVNELFEKYSVQITYTGYGGNGTMFDEKTVLTAAHVIRGPAASAEDFPIPGLDIALVQLPFSFDQYEGKKFSPDAPITNADIHGGFVSVVGVDDGNKAYTGIAVKVSSELAQFWGEGLPASEISKFEDSFVMILPPGEAKEDEKGIRPAQGMSGSTVFLWKNNEYVPAGVFYGVAQYNDPSTKRTIDIGFFHGIDEIRRVSKENKVLKPERISISRPSVPTESVEVKQVRAGA